MSFLAPFAFAAALFAIPIILMYMLRLRRQEMRVSSTLLWSQVLQDNEANTPWQKLKRNLLLLLQLLILALLVFALARPFVNVPAIRAGQVTVILDASASMNALDAVAGEATRSRWQAAQDEALRIIDTLAEGDRMTLIRAAAVPEIVVSAGTDRAQLRAGVNDASPSQAGADWTAALNVGLASGAGAEDFTLVIISDGGLPADVGLQGTDVDVRYIAVGTSAENTAISALATAALPGNPPQLFGQITNYGTLESQVTLTLLVDDERFDTRNLSIPAGAALPVLVADLPPAFRTIEARITRRVNSPAPDYLPLDDVAYAVAGDGGARRVLIVSGGNVFVEQVFRSLPDVEAIRTVDDIADGFDLYVLDGRTPDPLPDGNLLFINPTGDSPFFRVTDTIEAPSNPRIVDENDPRLRFVDMGGVNFLRVAELAGIDWATPLITIGDDVPLLLAGERDGRRVAILAFDPSESDLPLQIAWPVLIANLTEWFAPAALIDVPDSLRAGEPLTITAPLDADALRITAPDGTTQDFTTADGTIIYNRTDTPGLYRIAVIGAGGNVLSERPFAVNLFDAQESDIAPVAPDALSIAGAQVNAPVTAESGQRELWPLAALAALLVLLLEWYAHHRRQRMPLLAR
ncbi:MAG: VWA domain-containing protein [Anaerolineaceae bacterium]|nr:MAG: VWA domain-containing protein [Anaerolineaceae bacterium]